MLGRSLTLAVSILCTVCIDGAFCASVRGGVQKNQPAKTTAARAATNARSVSRGDGAAGGAKIPGRVTAARSATPTKSASTKSAPTISARAATTQNVIGTGTKVSGAAQNTLVADDCQKLYNACMDTFCVGENFDGGRCICSDKYRTFNKYWTEIDDLNQQTYKLQTVGVESIEAVVTKNPALQTPVVSVAKKAEIKEALESGDIGGAQRQTAHDACVKQIPQCKDKLTVLSAMYSGQINGDCIAYENSLKKLKTEAKQRLTNAERGLQEIALDSAKNANKYDLGQCTIKFRECMMGKDVCGADFTGCVDVVEQTNVRIRNIAEEEIFVIPNTTADLTLSKSMHESLMAKSVICKPVLENCVNVADSVFDTFLRDSYSQLRIAEDLAESNARQSCITKVSDCFKNACRDNIDPNDKDASYDACLTRPEMMLSFCKPELNACGVDSTDAKTARKSEIWDFVLARLAGMKVDACTTDLKNCLADENRCGADFSKCVGLSTEQIIRMCPYDKLVGCKTVYDKDLKTDEVYNNLNNVVQGIILNIDNKMLATCQAAVDSVAQRVCGENLDCGNLINLNLIGTTSLDYKICEYRIIGNDVAFTDNCHRDQSLIPDVDLGRVEYSKSGELGPVVPYTVLIDVPIYWEAISVGLDGKFVGIDNYMEKLEERQIFITDEQKARLEAELNSMTRGLDNIIKSIEDDPIVSACMNGRKIDGYDFDVVARFPNITQNTRALIATRMLNRAKKNYYAKYDSYNERQLQDFLKISERQAAIKGENFKDRHREIARQSCVSLAEMSALPKTAEPPSSLGGGILIGIILALAIVATCVLTFGGGAAAIGAVAAGTMTTATSVSGTAVGVTTAAASGSAFGAASVTLGSVASGAVASTATLGAAVSTVGGAVAGTTAVVGGSVLTATTAGMGIAGIVAGTIGGAAAITTAGLAINDAVEGKNVTNKSSETFDMSHVHDYNGEYKITHWNFKEEITTVFNPTDLTCEKCTVTTKCAKTKAPMFGDQYCSEWEESSTKNCTTIEF